MISIVHKELNGITDGGILTHRLCSVECHTVKGRKEKEKEEQRRRGGERHDHKPVVMKIIFI